MNTKKTSLILLAALALSLGACGGSDGGGARADGRGTGEDKSAGDKGASPCRGGGGRTEQGNDHLLQIYAV